MVSESFSSVVLTVYAVLLRTVFHQYLNKKDTQKIEQILEVVSCYMHAIVFSSTSLVYVTVYSISFKSSLSLRLRKSHVTDCPRPGLVLNVQDEKNIPIQSRLGNILVRTK